MEGPQRQWRQWVMAKYNTHNLDLVGQTQETQPLLVAVPKRLTAKKIPHTALKAYIKEF